MRQRRVVSLAGVRCVREWFWVCSVVLATVPLTAQSDVRGRLVRVHADGLGGQTSRELHFVQELDESDERTGRVFELRFRQRSRKVLEPGGVVRARGRAAGNTLVLDSDGDASLVTEEPAADTDAHDHEQPEGAGAGLVSNDRVLAIVANFSDSSIACSTDDVRAQIFGADSSVTALYESMSDGAFGFIGDVAGPYTISYSSSSSCSIWNWSDAADRAASSDGFDPSQYDNVVYVMPNSSCGWAGYGTYGGSPSRAWIFYCDMTDLYAHELGHNLGMRHASDSGDEYGDYSDIMGISGLPLRGCNAPHLDQLGWLPADSAIDASAGGQFTIAPLSANDSAAPRVLRLRDPSNGSSVYVSYRSRSGHDSTLYSRFDQRVSIHRWDGGTSNTYLLAVLVAGETYSAAGGALDITFLSQATDGAAVAVGEVIEECFPEEPSLIGTPGQFSGAAGQTARYTLEVSNLDGPGCDASSFTLEADLPQGWTGALSRETLLLAPGQTALVSLDVNAPVDALDGLHRIDLRAISPSGIASDIVYFSLDATAPTAPTSLSARLRKKKVELSWGRSTDNIGVVGYVVWRDGVALGQVSTVSFVDSSVRSGYTYRYEVEAVDAAGNLSPPSNPVSVTVSSGGSKGGGGGRGRR